MPVMPLGLTTLVIRRWVQVLPLSVEVETSALITLRAASSSESTDWKKPASLE